MTWTELQAEPAFGFMVVGLIIVFGPLVAERVRLPGLLGLLVFGALVGPNILDLFPTFATLRAVGDIGVLYLIFLSGLQLDLDAFAKHWRISAGFGALTSIFPLVLGFLVAVAFDIDTVAAILIGSFWASFTLIAYPVMTRYGLTKNRAVAAIVGASSITDTVSLVILALVVGYETGDVGGVRLVLELAVGFAILAVHCFVIVPAVARWFFSGLGQERTLRFMLVLVAMTSAATVSDVVGVEPLIGAFFVGVGLNRMVPNASPLMAVTDFFGNAFFIPAFLVSVGLLFDPALMVQWSTIRLALGFTAALVAGKAIAAVITGRIFRLDPAEVGLMFSVSVAQAAATLAATIVGLDAGLYGDDVVNAVMVVVSLSLVITSVGSERFAPRVEPPATDARPLAETILVPIERDPDEIVPTLRFAAHLAERGGGVVQPVVVVTTTDDPSIDHGRERCDRVDHALRAMGRDVQTLLRIDRSVATGVHRASIETEASMLVLPWPEAGGLRAWLLGASHREIVAASSIPTAVAAIHDGPAGRVVLVGRTVDLLPGRAPSLLVAAELALRLTDRDHPLAAGPVGPAAMRAAGAEIPEQVEVLTPGPDFTSWLSTATRPGDLVIVPVDNRIAPTLVTLNQNGRSVLAVAHNPASETHHSGSPLTFPVGGSLGPT